MSASSTRERICVFCGANAGERPAYAAAARELGESIVRRGLGLVYGGGSVGLMGAIADAVLGKGGEAIGVIPETLVARELAHRGLTELRVVRTMHERKATMADLSAAFVTLPGGFGTLDETCEVLSWAQLGLHEKPCGILDVEGYFGPWLEFLDRAVREGFLQPGHRRLLVHDTEPDRLLGRLLGARVSADPSRPSRRRT